MKTVLTSTANKQIKKTPIAKNKTQIVFTSIHIIPSLLGKSGISGLCFFTLLAGDLQLIQQPPRPMTVSNRAKWL